MSSYNIFLYTILSMQLWIFPKTEHILLAPLNHRLLSVDQCSDGSYSYCFPNQSSMKCFTAFVRSLVLSVLFKDASNHLEPVTRGTQTQKRGNNMKQFRIGSSTFTSLTGFVVVFWVFWAPNAPRYPRRRLGRWSWWKGREGRSSRKQPKWQETWSHIHLWSIIAIQIILTYLDYETIIIIGDDHYDDHYYCHHHWGPCSKVWESFPLTASPSLHRSKSGYWPNICTTNTKNKTHTNHFLCMFPYLLDVVFLHMSVSVFPGKYILHICSKNVQTKKQHMCKKELLHIFFACFYMLLVSRSWVLGMYLLQIHHWGVIWVAILVLAWPRV